MSAATPSYQFIETSRAQGIGRLTLDRPDALNALHPPMMGEIMEAVAAFEDDPDVRVLLIEGRGRGFSAGGDFDFLDRLTETPPFEIKDEVYRYFAGGVKSIRLFPKPTIAAMQGAATGAGLEIGLACDFRIAATDAVLIETWINLGLISPLGGMALLPRLVGLAKANEILMLGERVDGAEAERIGLVNRAVEPDQLEQTALDWARRLAAGAPLALRAMKEGIRRGLENPLVAEWEHNVYVQAMLLNSADFAEGVRALHERRAPVFKGE